MTTSFQSAHRSLYQFISTMDLVITIQSRCASVTFICYKFHINKTDPPYKFYSYCPSIYAIFFGIDKL
jgi:hypothetical protein